MDDLDSTHGLWIGQQLPDAQVMCINSCLRAGHPYKLYSYQWYHNAPRGVEQHDAAKIVPYDIYDRWFHQHGQVRHACQTFANYFRYKLLYETGGWWLDTDLYLLKPLPKGEYIFTSVHDIQTREELLPLKIPAIGGNVANGMFRVPPQAPLLSRLVRAIEPLVVEGVCPPLFGQWGTIAFTKAVVACGLYDKRIPLIGNGWENPSSLYLDPAKGVPEWAYALHLYNFVNANQRCIPGSLYDHMRKGLI